MSNSDRPRAHSRVVLVLELVETTLGSERALQVMASIPGRESVSVQTWTLAERGVDASQMLDVTTTVTAHLYDAVYASNGMQLNLGPVGDIPPVDG